MASKKTRMASHVPSLEQQAIAIVREADLETKKLAAHETASAWLTGRLALTNGPPPALAKRPGRPDRPELLPPGKMPRRSRHGLRGRIALLHALAHIELNAIDLTWDLIARAARHPLPRSFFDNWVQVGLEEARHFDLLQCRLAKLGAGYGDLPAHDGLWEAADETGHDLLARLAVVPLVLEARGLDVTPSTIARMRESGDEDSADILAIIYRDEKRHVGFGAKWFRFLCDRKRLRPEPTFQRLVRTHFKGTVKPPFNDRARSEAGLTPAFYKPLVPII